MRDDDLAGRVAELEHRSLCQELLLWAGAGALILLILALRRKGIITTDLVHEAFPRG